MKGLLLDPYNQSISEIELDGTLNALYKALSPDGETPVTCFERVRMENDQHIYVDESGLLNSRKAAFRADFYPDPIAGKGVILGSTPSGEDWDSTPLNVEELDGRFSWLVAR